MAEWRNAIFRPCHFLAVDRARRWAICQQIFIGLQLRTYLDFSRVELILNPSIKTPSLRPFPLPLRRLVLSVRGSLELGDICTDLTVDQQPWDEVMGSCCREGGRASDGREGGMASKGRTEGLTSSQRSDEEGLSYCPSSSAAVGSGSGSGQVVHKGMLTSALYVGESIAKPLAQAVEAFPDWPLMITGR